MISKLLVLLIDYHIMRKSSKKLFITKSCLMRIFFYFIGIQNLFDKRYLFFRNALIAQTIRKTSVFAGIPSIREEKERDRTLFYYSTPATFTAGSFLLHFPIFFLHPFPPVFPRIRRSLERRRTGAS